MSLTQRNSSIYTGLASAAHADAVRQLAREQRITVEEAADQLAAMAGNAQRQRRASAEQRVIAARRAREGFPVYQPRNDFIGQPRRI